MPLAIFCGCTAWFVSDMVRNPEDRLSHDSIIYVFSSIYREVSEAGDIMLLENMTEHYAVITIRIKDCKGKILTLEVITL